MDLVMPLKYRDYSEGYRSVSKDEKSGRPDTMC